MATTSQLQKDVITELGWKPSVIATYFGLRANQGAVTLTGQGVPFGGKYAATATVRRPDGRIGLSNRSRLTPTRTGLRAAEAIRQTLRGRCLTSGGLLEWFQVLGKSV